MEEVGPQISHRCGHCSGNGSQRPMPTGASNRLHLHRRLVRPQLQPYFVQPTLSSRQRVVVGDVVTE